MKLDPKKVKFISPFTPGIFTRIFRFVGREKTVQLQETALVIEGNLLIVSLLGLEMLFRRALAEWSSVTIPYSRIIKVRRIRFPLLRLLALIYVVLLSILVVFMIVQQFIIEDKHEDPSEHLSMFFVLLGTVLLAIYLLIRIPPRHAIIFRGQDGRRSVLQLQIKGKKLRLSFAKRLKEYQEASRKYGTSDLKRNRGRLGFGVVAGLAGLLLLTAGGVGFVGWKYLLPKAGTLGLEHNFFNQSETDDSDQGARGGYASDGAPPGRNTPRGSTPQLGSKTPSSAGGSQTQLKFEPLAQRSGSGPRLLPHEQMIGTAVWLPGDRLATIAFDNKVRIWNLTTGKGTAYTLDPGWSAFLFALTPDQSAPAGVKAAFTSGFKGVYLWQVGDNGPPTALPGSEAIAINGAFDPSGRVLTYTSGKLLCAWDVWKRTNIARLTIPSMFVGRASLSDDGKRLAAVEPLIHSLVVSSPGFKGIRKWDGYNAAAISPDGSALAVRTTGEKPVLRIVRPQNAETMREIGPASGNAWLNYAPGGRVLFGGEEAGVGFWDPATGKLLGRLGDGTFAGLQGVIDPTGSTIAVVEFNFVAVWRLPADLRAAIRGVPNTSEPPEQLPPPRPVGR